MEWGGLLLQAIMLGGFLLWEGYFKQKGKNLADKDDMREISFESEKGKNLATKQDMKDITKAIESVKDVYNSSLEKYKVDLQKEFESEKYIIDLCKKIDSELINLLINHIDATNKNHFDNYTDYATNSDAVDSLTKLANFLSNFDHRYGINEYAKSIINSYNEYKYIISEPEDPEELKEANERQTDYIGEVSCIFEESRQSSSSLLALFLPKLTFTNNK